MYFQCFYLLRRLEVHKNTMPHAVERCDHSLLYTCSHQRTYLNGSEGSHNGRATKTMRDKREMCEMALDAGIQDMLRSGIAQWGSVLVQQVH